MNNNPTSTTPAPHLFRIILPVSDIEKAATFYSRVLGIPGERVWENRHYYNCGGTILAVVSPGDSFSEFTPNPEHIFFSVANIDEVFERAKDAGCLSIDSEVVTQHWGERAFFAEDPFGNPICFVDVATLYTGENP
ncbi:MAG: VOC family protein [Chloroflexia bacterium]